MSDRRLAQTIRSCSVGHATVEKPSNPARVNVQLVNRHLREDLIQGREHVRGGGLLEQFGRQVDWMVARVSGNDGGPLLHHLECQTKALLLEGLTEVSRQLKLGNDGLQVVRTARPHANRRLIPAPFDADEAIFSTEKLGNATPLHCQVRVAQHDTILGVATRGTVLGNHESPRDQALKSAQIVEAQ